MRTHRLYACGNDSTVTRRPNGTAAIADAFANAGGHPPVARIAPTWLIDRVGGVAGLETHGDGACRSGARLGANAT